MGKIVFVRANVVVRHGGLSRRLMKGDAWDAADSIVKAHPDLFSDDVSSFVKRTDPVPPPVEQATANPGEKRTILRAVSEQDGRRG